VPARSGPRAASGRTSPVGEPWEAMDKTEPWEEMPASAQRDELLAAVGLLVEHIGETLRHPSPSRSYPMMPQVIEEMGRRYGPWAR